MVPTHANVGNTTVDYLIVTAIIAGTLFPIIQSQFGERIVGQLYQNRQSLVDFLAQTPKRPVPNIWFSVERQGDTRVGANVDADEKGLSASDFPDATAAQATDSDAREVGARRGVNPRQFPQAGKAQARSAGVGRTGSRVGAGGSGRSGFGGESGSLSSQFFDAGKKTGPGSGGGEGDTATPSGRRSYGGAVGGTEGSSVTDADVSSSGEGRRRGDRDQEMTQKVEGASGTRRSTSLAIAQIQQEERRRTSEFDWWFLIKFLIIILIFIFIILILLGNLRRQS